MRFLIKLFYRLLGIAAYLGSEFARTKVNLISCSVFPFLAILIVPFCCMEVGEAGFQGGKPHPVSLGAIVGELYSGPKFVTVTGQYVPGLAYDEVSPMTTKQEVEKKKEVEKKQDTGSETDSDAESDTSSAPATAYVAFADPTTGGAIMVELKDYNKESLPKGTVTITGMLSFLVTDLTTKLPEKAAGAKLSHAYYLEPGVVPRNPWGMVAIAVGVTVALVIYLVAFINLYVIFRKDPAPIPTLSPTDVGPGQIDMGNAWATGQFILPGSRMERLLHVRSFIARRADGEVDIYAYVRVSRSSAIGLIPISTENITGYWVMAVTPGTVSNVVLGEQYYALSCRRAVRFDYVEATNHQQETAVLSFANEKVRQDALAMLLGANANRPNTSHYDLGGG